MRMRCNVSGTAALIDQLRRMEKAGEEAGKAVLVEVADAIVSRARTLAPVDDEDGGELRDSIRRTRPTRTRYGSIVISIIAGGAALAKVMGPRKYNIYAVLQHEDLTLKHKVGGPMFVERPTRELGVTVPDKLAAALKAAE